MLAPKAHSYYKNSKVNNTMAPAALMKTNHDKPNPENIGGVPHTNFVMESADVVPTRLKVEFKRRLADFSSSLDS